VTVIVATREGMWCDSKVSAGGLNYPSEKVFRYKGDMIATAGNDTGIEKWLHWFKGDRKKPLTDIGTDDSFTVLVLNKEGLFIYDDCSLRNRITRDWHAIGDGAIAAAAALKMGATPHRAVEIACELVDSCGLPVEAHKLKCPSHR
jgi:hypothetical protein